MKAKRLPAMLIAFVMVFTLLPATAVAAEETTESFFYLFNDNVHNYSQKQKDYQTENSTTAALPGIERWRFDTFIGDEISAPWEFVNYSYVTGGWVAPLDGYFRFAFKQAGGNRSFAEDQIAYTPGINDTDNIHTTSLTLSIKVGADGIYYPTLSVIPTVYSPNWDVYLTSDVPPAGGASSEYKHWIDNELNSCDRIGTIDCYGTTTSLDETPTTSSVSRSKTFLPVKLKKDTVYYLVFVSNGVSDGFSYSEVISTGYPAAALYINSLTLTNAATQAPKFEYDMSINAVSSDSERIDTTNSKVIFESDMNLQSSALDVSKTSLYSMYLYCFRNKLSGGKYYSYIDTSGLQAAIYANYYVDPNNVPDHLKEKYSNVTFKGKTSGAPDIYEPHIAIDLGNLTEGEYKISIYNEVATAGFGAHTKVYFGKAPSSYTNANLVNWRSEGGDGKLIGWHNSQIINKEASPEQFTVNVQENSSYYLVFIGDEDSLAEDKNPEFEISTSHQYFHLSGIKIESLTDPLAVIQSEVSEAQNMFSSIKSEQTSEIKAAEASGLSDNVTVNVLATAVDGDDEFENSAKQEIGKVGDAITVTAKPIDGYNFLYWAKGIGSNRQGVSVEDEYKFKPTSGGGVWLTAVYKPSDSAKVPVVFYNGNGDEISRVLADAGSTITMPELPTLDGYPNVIGWALGNKDNILEAGDTVEVSGNQMYFVAQFEDPEADITVTVDGKVYGTYAYGDKVTVEATERENGSGENVFVYWKKDDEIVSFNRSYTFTVYDNCSLTTYYDFYKPLNEAVRKIIIKEEGQKLMAEFIGLDSAVEKGIIFNKDSAANITFANATHKIAMTTSGNQLMAKNDVGTYIGYAILSDGTVVYDK